MLNEIPEFRSLPANLLEEMKEDLMKRRSVPKIDQIYFVYLK